MKRKIINIAEASTDVEMTDFADGSATWLEKQMRDPGLKYLLAHADDGVIWGRLDGNKLITSHDVVPEKSPPLRAKTLQMARIFGPDGEILVWRDEAGEWAGRLIAEAPEDKADQWTEAFEEEQVLLGTNAEPVEHDFTLMSEGAQGLFHVVPLTLSQKRNEEQWHPLRLVVRHYITVDKYGFVRVDASRLVILKLEAKGE